MTRLLKTFCVLAALMVFTPRAYAWDEVVHGRLTEAAIADVKTPALKAFLLAHRDALISGAWFPDWGHAMKPQGEADHSFYLDSAHDYLARPTVRAEAAYPDLLAHYMGAYAHVVEDRVVDATLKRHAEEVGEGGRDDMENGMMEIAAQGWLNQDFKRYVPSADLARIFAEAHYYRDPRLNAANFDAKMRRAMAKGEIVNSELKLLSFLTVGYERRAYPWGAVNVPTAPGGFASNAEAVAAGWEAIWREANGQPAPFFVYSLPRDGGQIASIKAKTSYGRITIVTRRRFDMRDIPASAVKLTDAQGRAIPVKVLPYIDEPNLYPYIATVGHDLDLAFQVQALKDFIPGQAYRLTIAPGDYAPNAGPIQPFQLNFTAPVHPLFQQRMAAPRPWAMGMFVFVFVGSLAGMAFGAPDVMRLALTPKAASPAAAVAADPAWLRPTNLVFKAIALVLAAIAIWMLLTDGALFIEFLRRHH
jgi:hypothetical protein